MRYGEKVAVDDLDLTVDRHTITAVLGPNGAGKTTTLETCEGYRKPQQGSVSVLGLDPQRQRRELLPRIGVMLQDGGAWSGVRAMEMLAHIARLHADPLDVDALGERVGLGDCGRTPYRRLSGGQQQRLKLAMAIVGRPELVFVDEPTAGMDPGGPSYDLGAAATAAHRRRDRRAHHAPHGRGRAPRRPDPHHRPRPDDRLRHAAGADPRRHLDDPARGHQAVPRRSPRVAAAGRSGTASR